MTALPGIFLFEMENTASRSSGVSFPFSHPVSCSHFGPLGDPKMQEVRMSEREQMAGSKVWMTTVLSIQLQTVSFRSPCMEKKIYKLIYLSYYFGLAAF